MPVEFAELKSDSDWSDAFDILNSLKPSLDHRTFLSARERLYSDGYLLFGLKNKAKLISVAGAIIVPHIIDKYKFWVLDMATSPEYRSRGYGFKMLKFLEKFALENSCKKIVVHSRIERDHAHDFYKDKCGFCDYAYLFSKSL